MITESRLDQLILAEGVIPEELQTLSIPDKLQYLKHHHQKQWERTNILFIGFSEHDLKSLFELCTREHFIVKKQLSHDLNFICVGPLADSKRIEKAKHYCRLMITESELKVILSPAPYTLDSNPALYNQKVEPFFRIAMPLSNFDHYTSVESFNEASQLEYNVNLFQLQCTCSEFKRKSVE